MWKVDETLSDDAKKVESVSYDSSRDAIYVQFADGASGFVPVDDLNYSLQIHLFGADLIPRQVSSYTNSIWIPTTDRVAQDGTSGFEVRWQTLRLYCDEDYNIATDLESHGTTRKLLGYIIKLGRTDLNLTLEQLSEKVQVSADLLRALENSPDGQLTQSQETELQDNLDRIKSVLHPSNK